MLFTLFYYTRVKNIKQFFYLDYSIMIIQSLYNIVMISRLKKIYI